MTEPIPLSKEDRVFSFGNDLDLSLSLPSSRRKSSPEVTFQTPSDRESIDKFEYLEHDPLQSDIGATSKLRKSTRRSTGSVHFSHHEGIPYDENRPISAITYSTRSSIPYAESSRSAEERGDLGDRIPSDFERFLAKSREDYERDKERNWPTVEIDDTTFLRAKEPAKHIDRRKQYSSTRTVFRVLQVFTSVVILALVTTTISKVQDTEQQTQQNDEGLWPSPVSLWPEYLVTAVSALSFAISLLMVLGIFFIDRLNELQGRLGLYMNFCINLILFVTWIIAIILFRVNSSSDSSIWGFSCSHSIMSNAFVDYNFICTRETATWAMSIISAFLESAVLMLFLLTYQLYYTVQSAKEEAQRISNMRKSVHRTMTGSGRMSIPKGRLRGWEAGADGMGTPRINVIPVSPS